MKKTYLEPTMEIVRIPGQVLMYTVSNPGTESFGEDEEIAAPDIILDDF